MIDILCLVIVNPVSGNIKDHDVGIIDLLVFGAVGFYTVYFIIVKRVDIIDPFAVKIYVFSIRFYQCNFVAAVGVRFGKAAGSVFCISVYDHFLRA